MQFTKQDLQQLENLMRALRGGTFTFQGLEVLAFADCMKWASKLHENMSNSIIIEEQRLINSKLEVKESPFKEDPIKNSIDKVTKKKK
jgi:hypothetical protein